jgi:hypothetical protein
MDDERPSARADLFAGLAFLAVSVAIIIGSMMMDRLERLQATIYTAPGLVPGILGLMLAAMAVLLIVRALRGGALSEARPAIDLRQHWRLAVSLVLCLGFAIVLVGHGMPFWLAAATYIALFLLIFQFEERRRDGTVLKGIAFAIVYGLIAGLAIHHLFQDVFLVRLP